MSSTPERLEMFLDMITLSLICPFCVVLCQGSELAGNVFLESLSINIYCLIIMHVASSPVISKVIAYLKQL